ncbi:unnamed protein product [Vitrella brassicaformis CCMP3155]|uniref:Uncharacterized protein n=1 Tax=Vitrella brassicaformis (strain CCMP3155) TaxID=1169540 RepID=A0A0G4EGY3_VITBC|nr:unnamed protein product [Vitrella brassicaformis CCMP3155]|eukprot:CEL95724.1 unnamed protein product [Vitrella brassicaformis CCMP3155]
MTEPSIWCAGEPPPRPPGSLYQSPEEAPGLRELDYQKLLKEKTVWREVKEKRLDKYNSRTLYLEVTHLLEDYCWLKEHIKELVATIDRREKLIAKLAREKREMGKAAALHRRREHQERLSTSVRCPSLPSSCRQRLREDLRRRTMTLSRPPIWCAGEPPARPPGSLFQSIEEAPTLLELNYSQLVDEGTLWKEVQENRLAKYNSRTLYLEVTRLLDKYCYSQEQIIELVDTIRRRENLIAKLAREKKEMVKAASLHRRRLAVNQVPLPAPRQTSQPPP